MEGVSSTTDPYQVIRKCEVNASSANLPQTQLVMQHIQENRAGEWLQGLQFIEGKDTKTQLIGELTFLLLISCRGSHEHTGSQGVQPQTVRQQTASELSTMHPGGGSEAGDCKGSTPIQPHTQVVRLRGCRPQ